MIAPRAAHLIASAATEPDLLARLRQAITYEELARFAQESGFAADAAELREAFRARDARVLAPSLMRAGLIADGPLIRTEGTWNPELWSRLEALDFSTIRQQMITRHSWTPERADLNIRRYRRFLYLALALEDLRAVPTPDIDEVWHQHILNTAKYAADCESLGRGFIHHNPANTAEESETNANAVFDMWVGYESVFGEPYDNTIIDTLIARWPSLVPTAAAA